MADLSTFKTPIFAGVNDIPKVATATEAGNGSDLIKKLNDLCDYLSENLAPVATSGEYEDLENKPLAIENWNVNGTVYENVKNVVINGNFVNVSFYEGQLTLEFQGNTNPIQYES